MKISFINGSPKIKNNASGQLLEELKGLLEQEEIIISDYHFNNYKIAKEDIQSLKESDVLVFAFPLYVDGIPGHLVSCLLELEALFKTVQNKEIRVYTLINCGFYEGNQNQLAMEMMENWCYKTGLKWGQGIGIGAGGMLLAIKNIPLNHGPKKSLGKAFKQLSANISKGTTSDNLFVTVNFPRFLYKFSGECSWRQLAKENGLKTRDLFAKK